MAETARSSAEKRALRLRNEQWAKNELIPRWVDPKKVDLDRFFTRENVARECHSRLLSVMVKNDVNLDEYVFVDAGAGKGVFFDLLPEQNRIGVELVPNRAEFVEADFLSWLPATHVRCYAAIGNPPFGHRGWQALAFMNHAASFANYIGFILPMAFQSDGKGSPRYRVLGAELVESQLIPPGAFEDEEGKPVRVNALWQIWKRGVNKRKQSATCNDWLDLFTVDLRRERRCGHERLCEATWFLQRTFYGSPPSLVRDFSDVRYGCGYGIVIKKDAERVESALRRTDWLRFSNLAAHNCHHISMYHIRNALIDAGFIDEC